MGIGAGKFGFEVEVLANAYQAGDLAQLIPWKPPIASITIATSGLKKQIEHWKSKVMELEREIGSMFELRPEWWASGKQGANNYSDWQEKRLSISTLFSQASMDDPPRTSSSTSSIHHTASSIRTIRTSRFQSWWRRMSGETGLTNSGNGSFVEGSPSVPERSTSLKYDRAENNTLRNWSIQAEANWREKMRWLNFEYLKVKVYAETLQKHQDESPEIETSVSSKEAPIATTSEMATERNSDSTVEIETSKY